MHHEDDYLPGNAALAASGSAHVLTGCSGGGKSTLIAELARRGFRTVPEAGRQVVREQVQLGGQALPWIDASAFVELAASRTIFLYNITRPSGHAVFFDRSLVDLTAFLEMKSLPIPADLVEALRVYRYARRVFVTPPWRDIYRDDPERSKTFEQACAEYDALVVAYRRQGYVLVEVPRVDVSKRADFILHHCEGEAAPKPAP